MNEQGEQIKKNFLEQWIRLAFVLLYIIVFGLLWRFIAVLLLVVIILQSLHRVVAAENNNALLTFSEGLGNFLLKVLQYVLYLSDEKPIGFDAFFGQKGEATANTSQSAEEKPAEPENAEEVTVQQSVSDAEDDVFADISFTEKAEDTDDEDEQSKKTD